MKYLLKCLFICLLLWYCNQSYCQSTDMPSNNLIFQVVEKMPEFPGGGDSLISFINDNIKYPDSALAHHIEGRVVLGFVINADGKITEIAIKHGISPEIDAEAIRIVRLFPTFRPGRQQGKAVRVSYVLPILFKLGGNSSISDKPHTLQMLNRDKRQ